MAESTPVPPPTAPPSLAAPSPVAPQGEPEVIAESGQFLLKVTDPFTAEFNGHYPADDKTPQAPVILTHTGVQVTKAQGQHLQRQAAEHGVATSLEKVSNDGGR